MLLPIGPSEGYFISLKLNADDTMSGMYQITRDESQNPPYLLTIDAQGLAWSFEYLNPQIMTGTYRANLAISPEHVMTALIGVQRSYYTSEQLQTWISGLGNTPIISVKGFTSFDYIPGSVAPTAADVFNNLAVNAFDLTDTLTMRVHNEATTPVPILPVLTSNQIAMSKMYLAAFLRAPELGGLNYWSDALDSGNSLSQVGNTIFNLDIVKAIYPDSMSNTDFVTAIYKNIFHKIPDAQGLAYWKSAADSGTSRGDLVMTMMNTGLDTPVDTIGRPAIVHHLTATQYATRVQVKNNLEFPVDFLINQTNQQGSNLADVATYQSVIDAQMVSLIGIQDSSTGII